MDVCMRTQTQSYQMCACICVKLCICVSVCVFVWWHIEGTLMELFETLLVLRSKRKCAETEPKTVVALFNENNLFRSFSHLQFEILYLPSVFI